MFLKNQPGPLQLLRRVGIFYLVVQILLRFVLTLQSWGEMSHAPLELAAVLVLGPVYDISAILWQLLPLVLLLLAVPRFLCEWRLYERVLKLVCFGYVFGGLLTALSEYFFWEEFKGRFNFIAVDYLIYTQELFGNIFQSYNVPLLLGIVLVLTFLCRRRLLAPFEWPLEPVSWGKRGQVILLYVLLLAVTTLGLKADYLTKLSANRYNQELAANGVYQFGYAFFHNQLDYERFYLHRDKAEVLADLRARLSRDGSRLSEAEGVRRIYQPQPVPAGKNVPQAVPGQKPNIVFIVVESLSAGFTGLVQGPEGTWTPKLDDLTDVAYTFERVYATGTRTVRGLEAVSLSVPPTPGQSIVRRPDCAGLFNAGTPLRRQGYKTEFVYGGYGYFDNMNDFFAANGFDVVDRTDIPKEKIYFDTVWGVADEIMFDKLLEQLDAHHAAGEPVLEVALTTSNHRPFTFPEGRIDEKQGIRESVVRYTDWAIDRFLTQAKEKPWFDNTVFIIMADHNAAVAGKVGLPVSNYHIPCVVYAPKLIGKGENPRFMSQIDILPTVLGMLNLNGEVQHLGYDMMRLPAGEERFFISTYQQLGYIYKDKLLILEPGRKVSAYRINNYDLDDYTRIEPDEELIRGALAWYQGASCLYENGMLKEAK